MTLGSVKVVAATMPWRTIAGALGWLVLVFALVAGPGFARAAEPPKKDMPAAAIYHNYCSVCHGDRGDAQSRARGSLNPPPRDFTTTQALSELSRERMLLGVKHGRPGTAMVGYTSQLTQAQIEAVVDYIRDNFMRASTMGEASRGRQIYAKSCSVCHGDQGQGSLWASSNLKPPPRNFTSAESRAELTRERMIIAVTGGRPGTAMTGYATQLKHEEIEAVVDYMRSAFMRIGSEAGISGTQAHGTTSVPAAKPAPSATTTPVTVDMSVPMPGGLVGQVAAGKKFYDANCATCHGVKGDGQGPRAYFINPKPRIFITPEFRALFNRPAIYAATSAGKLGTEMPAWDKVLDRQQLADVTEYVFQAFVQPNTKTAKAAARTKP